MSYPPQIHRPPLQPEAAGANPRRTVRNFLEKRNIKDVSEWVQTAVQDEVRDQVTDKIHDELTGAVAEIADATGEAIGVLRVQLKDNNAAIRQRAADKILKYSMEIQKQRPHTEDTGPSQIEISVGSTFQNAVQRGGEMERAIEHPNPDDPALIDVPMIQCKGCGELKHAEIVDEDGKCSSCRMLGNMEKPSNA